MASATPLLPPSGAPRTRIWNSFPPWPTSCTTTSRSSGRDNAARMSAIGVAAANRTCTMVPPAKSMP